VTALLEAHDVRKFYGAFCALGGVSVTVNPGEFISIVGPNGAGKTTLVNVLTGLVAPTAGTVRFDGRDVTGLGTGRLARLGLARSFQLVNVFPALTVGETLAVSIVSHLGHGGRLFTSLARDRVVHERVREVAALFALEDRLGRPARTLAHGDRKLLDVATAFALEPRVILLDEPTSGVSTRDKHAIMEVLVKAARRVGIKAIIQVEHDMDLVFAYSDRVVALHQGRVLADTTPAGLLADAELVATVIGKRRVTQGGTSEGA
jgi:branched-chain amino acid transport system ATP-binding protein